MYEGILFNSDDAGNAFPAKPDACRRSSSQVGVWWHFDDHRVKPKAQDIFRGRQPGTKDNLDVYCPYIALQGNVCGNTGTDVEDVVVRNNDETKPFSVFTIDGRKVGTLKDRKETLSLKRGVYIINGKKIFIK